MPNRFFKLGKKPPRHDPRTFNLRKYFSAKKAGISLPPTFDNRTLISQWMMYGNDQFGDCTCAGYAELVRIWSAMAHSPITPSENDVLQLYYDVDNNGQPFAPGSPQDQGADLLTVLNTVRKTDLTGVRPLAFISIDISDEDQVKEAIALFGGLYAGVALPTQWQAQSGPGGVWSDTTGDPGTWGGHCIPLALYYDADKIGLATWGEFQYVSWAGWNKYGDEGFIILPEDWQGITGFDLPTLLQDLRDITINNP